MKASALAIALTVSALGCSGGEPSPESAFSHGDRVIIDNGSDSLVVWTKKPTDEPSRNGAVLVNCGETAMFLGKDQDRSLARVKIEGRAPVWVVSAWVKPDPANPPRPTATR